MRILLVNQAFYPDVVATAQYLTDAALALQKAGHVVTVVSWRRGYVEPHPLYPPKETYRGVKIIRVWPFALGRTKKIFRVLDACCLNLAFLIRILFLPRFDCIVALTSPPLVGLMALLVARFKKSRFVYWVMDLNPDEAIEMGWIKREALSARFLGSSLRYILKHSHQIVALDRFMKERLVDKGAQASKISVIAPWPHEELVAVSHEENPFRKQRGLENKFVVMYSGNHSVCHPLDTLLEAALVLKDDSKIVFLFIGGGARVADVLAFKEKHGLENIQMLPYQERAMLKYSLSAADVHVAVMGERMVGIVHPCKIYGVLQLGKPFIYIGPAASALNDLAQKAGVGFSLRHGNIAGVTQAILKVRSLNLQDLKGIAAAEMECAEEFSARHLIPQLQTILTIGLNRP